MCFTVERNNAQVSILQIKWFHRNISDLFQKFFLRLEWLIKLNVFYFDDFIKFWIIKYQTSRSIKYLLSLGCTHFKIIQWMWHKNPYRHKIFCHGSGCQWQVSGLLTSHHHKPLLSRIPIFQEIIAVKWGKSCWF